MGSAELPVEEAIEVAGRAKELDIRNYSLVTVEGVSALNNLRRFCC